MEFGLDIARFRTRVWLSVTVYDAIGLWGLWRYLRWRDHDIVLDRVRPELLARHEQLRDVTGRFGVRPG